MFDAALDLNALFGTDPGRVDFYGGQIPRELAFDVGAYE
jgi:hypothetical protein